jgi:prefoldin subunit 5
MLPAVRYVPGKALNVDSVLVDIGTGYYVEKTTKAAEVIRL